MQTLASVSDVGGSAAELCDKAMRTLLHSYIGHRHPSEWRSLFKEATNIAFMVKYMFRESLPICKQRFEGVCADTSLYKKMPNPAEVNWCGTRTLSLD